MIIGITGGTGAGKTTALRVLGEMGAYIMDCDAIYHELLTSSEPMKNAINDEFSGVLLGGEIDRKALGRAVFASEAALKKLNAITHPFVLEEVHRRIERERDKGREHFAIDAIALFEGGEADNCDYTVFVAAPKELRAQRIMAREGISREYAILRIDAQKPDEYFEKRCDFTLHNDFSDENTFRDYCGEFFHRLLKGEINMADKRDELMYKPKHVADIISAEEKGLSDEYCEKYKAFMSKAKTERLAVKEAVRLAEEAGFKPYPADGAVKPGDKIYRNIRGKALYLAVIGKKSLKEGANICAAHIDSPRLDLKQVPFVEKDEVAYLKTHYYGGIRKYQWVTIPLELHGVIIKRDGTSIDVSIGDDPADPTFVISDLLPHLGAKQGQEPLNNAIKGENLSLMIGSLPLEGSEGADRIKLNVLNILNEKYGVIEEDFLSAELEVVPGLPVRDVGFDRSLIAAYGHDDRVCAYAELQAIYEVENPEYTAVCILADKEEIGSVGVSGMESEAFECFMGDLCDAEGVKLAHCFSKSLCISADVTNAFDPIYPEVSDKQNNTKLNHGLGVCKFTGSRGKSGASDASAEVVGRVRKIFAENGVIWQTGELGKVDEGGGGTVAKFMANRNIDTIDAGVPVIAMHSPYEMVAKLDCYMCYKGMKAVYLDK